MHSKIFELREEKHNPTEWISESWYYEHFPVADYVTELHGNDRRNSIYKLKDVLEGIAEIDTAEETFTVINKEKYFEEKYVAFREVAAGLSETTLEDFMDVTGNTAMRMEKLNALFSDRFGYYVDDRDDYAGIQTFSDFMRRVNNGEVYHIGGVIDYHY